MIKSFLKPKKGGKSNLMPLPLLIIYKSKSLKAFLRFIEVKFTSG
jgi:hypothetical protein